MGSLSISRCFLIDAVSSTGNWLTEQRAINKSKISHFIVCAVCFVLFILLPLALAALLSCVPSFMRSAFSFLFSIVLITMR